MSFIKNNSGFTLVEVLIGTAIFLIVAGAAYGAFVALLRLANVSQANILAVELADEQFETIRNMPYTNVGLTNGIPQGVLPQTQTLVRGGFTFTVTLVIRSQDLVGQGVQASVKQVEVDIACASCQGSFTPVALTGQVSPANLQSAGAGGAVSVTVFDSNGNPVQGASVSLKSTATSSITDSDITNNSGVLNIIGVPAGYQVYHIIASSTGYSTASTSPNITVLNGQLTGVSLEIDKLSTLAVSSVSPTCVVVPNFNFNLTGSKMSGGNPLYSQNLTTNSAGSLNLPSMIPDTYTLLPKSGSSYDINGITPFSPFVLNPGSNQSLQLVVVPASENSLLVTVEDGNTTKPLSGASVQLTNTSGFSQTQITGQGYFDQTDWSGGIGTSNSNQYTTSNGVDTLISPGNILLYSKGLPSPYNIGAIGTLDSSTFDTSTTSNFYALNWTPLSQPVLTGTSSAKFQFATAPSSTGPWNFIGPDGTSGSYYTQPGMQIIFPSGGNEFARYKLFMTTQTATVTPSINDVSFSFTASCAPPGQVIFQGLPTGSYTLSISKSTYTTATSTITISSGGVSNGWQQRTVSLSQPH
jgi:prepilin-type N-terminal cleavage/methylation domain-containing protein